jgi:hypothetical protein
MPRTSDKKKICGNHYKKVFDEYFNDVNIPTSTVHNIMKSFALTRDSTECFLCADSKVAGKK